MRSVEIDYAAIAKYEARLLDGEGYPKLLPAEEVRAIIDEIGRDNFYVFCYREAIYQYPTTELINWLKSQISGGSAIEIGSGNNLIYKYLGIKGTDSCIQQRMGLVRYYQSLGQMPTIPPEDVETIEAIEAVQKYKPSVVIGCWITPKNTSQDPQGFRVDYDKMLALADRFIMVGNRKIHYDLSDRFDLNFYGVKGLISRALYPCFDGVFTNYRVQV